MPVNAASSNTLLNKNRIGITSIAIAGSPFIPPVILPNSSLSSMSVSSLPFDPVKTINRDSCQCFSKVVPHINNLQHKSKGKCISTDKYLRWRPIRILICIQLHYVLGIPAKSSRQYLHRTDTSVNAKQHFNYTIVLDHFHSNWDSNAPR